MSINKTLKVTSLLTVLCLSASLTITSCGKKEKVEVETKTEAVGDAAKGAAGAMGDAAKGTAGAVGDAAKGTAGAVGDAAKGTAGAVGDVAKGAAGAVGDAAKGVIGAPLSADEKAKLTPVKTALVMANTAVKSGDMTKAKAQFEKFNGLWTAVEPMVKEKAGPAYPAIESGLKMVTTAMGGASPDKEKAGEGLGMAMKAIDAIMTKK